MKDASGPETDTKTDTQPQPPLVVPPVAGPFKTDTQIERGFPDPIVLTMEDVSVVETPRYRFVPAESPPTPAPDDGSKAFVDEVYKGIPSMRMTGHFEPTGEVTTTTTKHTTTWTLSPMRFKVSEVFDDSHRFPMVVTGKAPCGCQDKVEEKKGFDVMSILMGGAAALAPQLLPLLSSLFGGKKSSSGGYGYVSPEPVSGSGPSYWQMYCEEKGLDPNDTSLPTPEQGKDFEQWIKDRVVGKSDPDPSTEH